jgi:hypothetical protein
VVTTVEAKNDGEKASMDGVEKCIITGALLVGVEPVDLHRIYDIPLQTTSHSGNNQSYIKNEPRDHCGVLPIRCCAA